MDLNAPPPDVSQIPRAQTELRACSVRAGEKDSSFCIVIIASTWNAMRTHAGTRLDAEVGGVLLGKMCRDARETPYLLVDGHVSALAAESRASNVTFTADSWTTIHETIDRDFTGAQIVGWYHTHPAFGIFLSEMDVFIHRHFFEAPHQVAIVIDPVANTQGGFAWREGTPVPQQLFIEPDGSADTSIDLREAFFRRERALAKRGSSLLGRLEMWFELLNPKWRATLNFLVFSVALALCCIALIEWTPILAPIRDWINRRLPGG